MINVKQLLKNDSADCVVVLGGFFFWFSPYMFDPIADVIDMFKLGDTVSAYLFMAIVVLGILFWLALLVAALRHDANHEYEKLDEREKVMELLVAKKSFSILFSALAIYLIFVPYQPIMIWLWVLLAAVLAYRMIMRYKQI